MRLGDRPLILIPSSVCGWVYVPTSCHGSIISVWGWHTAVGILHLPILILDQAQCFLIICNYEIIFFTPISLKFYFILLKDILNNSETISDIHVFNPIPVQGKNLRYWFNGVQWTPK